MSYLSFRSSWSLFMRSHWIFLLCAVLGVGLGIWALQSSFTPRVGVAPGPFYDYRLEVINDGPRLPILLSTDRAWELEVRVGGGLTKSFLLPGTVAEVRLFREGPGPAKAPLYAKAALPGDSPHTPNLTEPIEHLVYVEGFEFDNPWIITDEQFLLR